ncbi:MATE family efflux transporter [Kordiimonas sp. SCSIO 12610]|uniref:MATE family efflux transporter n=1 Tax=Kordiimonas sp. SCSIO 12610 TaxID=2829597 RepID=UPI00210D7318|nr:MATE family efflux transporter [Kordiimonas sp. SCSIO 12610]UTW56770.1 MATE family efflux transporter [Kordiimonas sp. SCSIO 12610]
MAQFSYQTVWRLAGPNIISNILFVSISFAHLWIVAPLGREASAAVVTGARVQFLLMSAAMALSVATTAVVARAWGADEKFEASASTTTSLALCIMVAVFLSVPTYVFAPQIVGIFGLDTTTTQMAVDYIRPVAIFNFAFALTVTMTTAMRAISDVIRPLRFTAAATVLSIIMSYILARGVFTYEGIGIAGIPIGTGAAQLLIVMYFMMRWLLKKYDLVPVASATFDNKRLAQLIKIGTPAALEQIIIQMSFVLFMVIIGAYGTAPFAAYGIGITILSVCIVVGLGFGAASSTLVGQSLGAGNEAEARASGWAAMRLAIGLMTIIAGLIYLMRGFLAALLSTDAETRELTEYFILILALIQPLMAIEFAIGGALRGAGDTRYPLFVSFAGMILGRLVIGYIIFKAGASIEAMFAIIILDYLIKIILLLARFRSSKWVDATSTHAPAAVQSVAGVSRVAVRSYYQTHNEEPE